MGCTDLDSAGSVLGADGEACAVGEGSCTEGTDGLAVPANVVTDEGAPDALVPPLPHAATDVMASTSAMQAVNLVVANDGADMIFTAWRARAHRRCGATRRCSQSPHADT